MRRAPKAAAQVVRRSSWCRLQVVWGMAEAEVAKKNYLRLLSPIDALPARIGIERRHRAGNRGGLGTEFFS